MITEKQKVFLDVLRNLVGTNGYFPTLRGINQKLRLSSLAAVQSLLFRFYETGYLRKAGDYWEIEPRAFTIPLVGYVPAGNPHEIFEHLGEEVELPGWMVDREGEILGFRVQGNSMIDAYIQEGDTVVVKKGPQADPGDMVVAMLEDETITLKRLKQDKGKNWLMPENPEYPPIFDPFKVIGKVVGLLRKYR
ncbi:MAG: repressor LexA [Candidatus Aminicenantes bacterium]|nr:repressor LexA [Candidatus Aminicenantes bacterium]